MSIDVGYPNSADNKTNSFVRWPEKISAASSTTSIALPK